MLTELVSLASSPSIHVTELDVVLEPWSTSLTVTGIANLETYSPTENPFTGGQAKQVKSFLQKLFPSLIVEVRLEILMRGGRGRGYVFSLTQGFDSGQARLREFEAVLSSTSCTQAVAHVSAVKLAGKEEHDECVT